MSNNSMESSKTFATELGEKFVLSRNERNWLVIYCGKAPIVTMSVCLSVCLSVTEAATATVSPDARATPRPLGTEPVVPVQFESPRGSTDNDVYLYVRSFFLSFICLFVYLFVCL